MGWSTKHAKGLVMQQIFQELRWRNLISSAKALGGTSYALLAVLFALLVFALAITVMGWHMAAGTDVPAGGYVAMIAGVLFSLLVGVGLMALVFYSSRAGYDEPAKLVAPEHEKPSE
jgi:hypothetical protein